MRKDTHGLLTDGTIEEVSVVTAPANKEPFLFMKSKDMKNALPMFQKAEDVSIEITSDGTKEGTTLTLKGKKIKNTEGVHFMVYEDYERLGEYRVECSYIQKEEKDGVTVLQTYYLRKEDNMIEKIMKQVQEVFGEDYKFEIVEKTEDSFPALLEALKVSKSYQTDFPEDLSKALTTLAQYALSGYEVEKTVETQKADEEAAPEDPKVDADPVEKKDEEAVEENPVSKALEDLTSSIAELKESLTEGQEQMENVSKRLEVVENTPNIRKSLEDSGTEVKKGPRYPSLAPLV